MITSDTQVPSSPRSSSNSQVVVFVGLRTCADPATGIGNKEILGKHGVETLLDLPAVGENLREPQSALAKFQFATLTHI